VDEIPTPLADALEGRYRLERELGRGGMATVYLAEDLKHHRHVALKVLKPELAGILGPERFLREIEVAARLRHPHILPLYDSGEAGGFLYYVMPLVEGESLRDRLSREKQLPVDESLAITGQVADALAYAHRHGVIHRDVKPENILLESGHAVVADFGIALAVSAAGGDRLTETGLTLGTPLYMSPEQAAGSRELDGRSDLYSLGCVLYEMLAGEPPFTGPTVQSVVHQHVAVEPRIITQVRPAVSGEVATTLARALAKAPADRWRSAEEFRSRLARQDTPSAPLPAAVPRRGRRALVIAVAAIALLAVVAVMLRRSEHAITVGRLTQVTLESGLELDPALSPDGKLVAYSDPQGNLMVRQVEGGTPVPVLRGAEGRGRWPAWLPDGQRLAYLSPRGIELVAALGGQPRLVVALPGPGRGIAVSPDGAEVAFIAHDTLFAQRLEGGAPRVITSGYETHSPAWSPDGRWIAFVKGNPQFISSTDLGNVANSSIQVVRADGGPSLPVTGEQTLSVSPAWISGTALLFVSDRDGGRDIYRVDLRRSGRPAGAARRLTTGLSPLSIAVSADRTRLAYAAFTETSNAWYVPIPTGGAVSVATARQLTRGNQLIENIGVSPDGGWLGFSSVHGGVSQIYRLRLDAAGAEPQQVTNDTASSYWADFSPDGREISFHRLNGDRRQIFVAPAEGGVAVAVTDGTEDIRSPDWSPDGRHLLVLANWATHPQLRIATRDARGAWSLRPLPVVVGSDTLPGGLGEWSPNGRTVACACGEGGLLLVPVDGGPARRLAATFSTAGWAFPQWSADGRTVYSVTQEGSHVTAVIGTPADGGPARVVVRFDDPTRPWHRFGFRVRAGRIYFTLGDRQSDIWTAQILQP